ncbi:TIGR01212 family radical SAM protein [Aureibacter tunicatorum]|uniref:Radical SAM core domain-containing protein n=1 Tax=Aureibacter tunicatorum TaxID=866807 RepID=A0AAE4BPP2_9BACT|nr:TIGR01212 family radical SAM protein [Aureibacter tunicatorum]MDR6238194.1 hypothetical protein [Aureibacter tunicatorum]BDD03227.1 TIGR01212 family radical SAM protein [Aureibacter tunicatorum]
MKEQLESLQSNFAWGHDLPYNSYTRYIKEKYKARLQKVSLHAGFTCPNRDGSKGRGGCTYCNNESFTPAYSREENDVISQINQGVPFLKKRYNKNVKFLAYFQAYTNTYGPLDDLKRIYEKALSHEDISGIVVSTRPDCVDERILDYLQELSEKHLFFLEFGVESCHDKALVEINRGHDFKSSVWAIEESVKRGLHTGVHLLAGLPGLSRAEMMDEANIISELPIDSLKIHQLQIIKGTIMAHQFKNNPESLNLFEKDEYIDFVIEFLERLRPSIKVQRLVSEAPANIKLAPNWGVRMDVLQNEIIDKMRLMGKYQGSKY